MLQVMTGNLHKGNSDFSSVFEREPPDVCVLSLRQGKSLECYLTDRIALRLF